MDRFFTDNPPILVFRDKDAIRSKRPQSYIDAEEFEYRRQSRLSTGAAREAADRRRASLGLPSLSHDSDGSAENGYGDEKDEEAARGAVYATDQKEGF